MSSEEEKKARMKECERAAFAALAHVRKMSELDHDFVDRAKKDGQNLTVAAHVVARGHLDLAVAALPYPRASMAMSIGMMQMVLEALLQTPTVVQDTSSGFSMTLMSNHECIVEGCTLKSPHVHAYKNGKPIVEEMGAPVSRGEPAP